MNKYLSKGTQLWHDNQIRAALHQYEKALHTTILTTQEKAIALYMSAYLHCTLARRANQTEAFLGVDLRESYQDDYLAAAFCLLHIEDSHFNATEWGLPVITKEAYALLEEAYQYYCQYSETYLTTWHLNLKGYLQQHLLGFVQRIQLYA